MVEEVAGPTPYLTGPQKRAHTADSDRAAHGASARGMADRGGGGGLDSAVCGVVRTPSSEMKGIGRVEGHEDAGGERGERPAAPDAAIGGTAGHARGTFSPTTTP